MRTSKQFRDMAEEFRALAAIKAPELHRCLQGLACTYDRLAFHAERDETEWAKFLREQENIHGVQARRPSEEKDPH